MKNLVKVTLKEFVEMTDKEMKQVVGGSGSSGGNTCALSESEDSGAECNGSCPHIVETTYKNGKLTITSIPQSCNKYTTLLPATNTQPARVLVSCICS